MSFGMRTTGIALLWLAALAASAQTPATQSVEDVRQGTNTAVAVSPDGQSLVTDLLGGLWRIPAAGGGAVPLVPPGHDARQPRFSPDGSSVVYQRYVDGQWDLWRLDLASGATRALTATAYDEQQPDFMADGRRIVFAANRTGRYALWSLDLAANALERLNDEPGDSFFPAVSESGAIAYIAHRGARWSLRLLDGASAGTELIGGDEPLSAPSWRPGGGVLVYQVRDGTRASRLEMLLIADERVVRPLTSGEDVFEARPAWLSPGEYLYTADGQIWRRGLAGFERGPVHLFAAVTLETALSEPNDAAVDATGPWAVEGSFGASRADDDETVAFAALGDIWLTGRRGAVRLTEDAFLDIDPSIHPDGSRVVFASDRGGSLDLWSVDSDGETLRPITSEPDQAFAPAVSPDGLFVAYLETAGLGPWAETRLGLLDLSGTSRTSRLGGPLYDADRPRWATVGPEPRIVIEARPETPNAPRRMLVFDIGGNRMPADEARDDPGTAPATVPAEQRPTWMRAVGEDAYVIEAGRVFDGIRNSYLRHVDIHVEGREIVAIVGRGVKPSAARIVDAREATVLPGLIDTHAHQSRVAGERLGRAWLAYGVTTVREVGGDPTEALARAETWASGALPGPRLLVAGTTDSAATSPWLLPTGHRIAGLVHELHAQSRRLGYPTLPQSDLLGALATDLPSGVERLRVSPLLASYQDTLGVTLASRRFLSTTLAAATGASVADRDGVYARLFGAREAAAWGDGVAGESLEGLEHTVTRLIRSGANFSTGSAAPAVPYGLGLHAELERLAAAGIPNDQVLRLATAQGARLLGLDARLGTLEAGKIADLVIVDGDPLARIADTRNVRAVVVEGRWLDREILLEPMLPENPTP